MKKKLSDEQRAFVKQCEDALTKTLQFLEEKAIDTPEVLKLTPMQAVAGAASVLYEAQVMQEILENGQVTVPTLGTINKDGTVTPKVNNDFTSQVPARMKPEEEFEAPEHVIPSSRKVYH